MSHQKRESYPIDTAEPSPRFLHARQVAGVTLQDQFQKESGKAKPGKDYRWIKAELTWPSFDDLTFAFGNQVFSVLVDLVEGGRSTLPQAARERCIKACRENRLVPCVFAVDAQTMQPVSGGWNLKHLVEMRDLIPADCVTQERIPMSAWERRNFAIQIVRDHLKKKSGTTEMSFCDVLDIDPQIWFEEPGQERSWVIVRDYPVITGSESKEFIGIEQIHSQLRPFDGYFAAVSFASSEPFLYDLSGALIPLSKRFDGSAPLYRGDGCHIKFDGLERIHVS